jgi:hypothetical protein
MKQNLRLLFAVLIVAFACAAPLKAQVAQGGSYTLEQSVIASGGGTSADAGNTFSTTGSIGQSITDASNGAPFTIKSGFFTAAPLAPTAAAVTVGGRVLTATGRGIRNVRITMTDSSGATRTAISTTFGYYCFTDVAAGETYIFTAQGKRFQFSQPSQVFNINEDTMDINFIANPRGEKQEIF